MAPSLVASGGRTGADLLHHLWSLVRITVAEEPPNKPRLQGAYGAERCDQHPSLKRNVHPTKSCGLDYTGQMRELIYTRYSNASRGAYNWPLSIFGSYNRKAFPRSFWLKLISLGPGIGRLVTCVAESVTRASLTSTAWWDALAVRASCECYVSVAWEC